jgi:hypothetical protein
MERKWNGSTFFRSIVCMLYLTLIIFSSTNANSLFIVDAVKLMATHRPEPQGIRHSIR